eukprot:CAMPEP_0185580738 /NCGR_PEP_ID=MMETSP0434-20130131/17612_1 /TAXON_ID=626734 ORGANISM="Favella taraikaensis, Strain Fe Narragansett Bay" /NCGR_SAMPLE_ID=MMETSP0434 /ASSEMBLY_ACC=CAM_ASM_000379 /LENGTH=72 /DNA_ID=CAMNT_0028199091 /DNA_START=765 /DNA_END=983 /DNA_ORIENTATION=-
MINTCTDVAEVQAASRPAESGADSTQDASSPTLTRGKTDQNGTDIYANIKDAKSSGIYRKMRSAATKRSAKP